MTQQVEEFANKSDDLNFIHRMDMVGGGNQLQQLFSDHYIHAVDMHA